MVTTSYADGDQPFRVLRKVELGPEDLTLVRLGADTGVSDHALEIRLEELTIRAEALTGTGAPRPLPALPRNAHGPRRDRARTDRSGGLVAGGRQAISRLFCSGRRREPFCPHGANRSMSHSL